MRRSALSRGVQPPLLLSTPRPPLGARCDGENVEASTVVDACAKAECGAAPPAAAPDRPKFVPPARRVAFRAPARSTNNEHGGRGASDGVSRAGLASSSSSSCAASGPLARANLAAQSAAYFTCHFTKRSNKKHKVYADGFLKLENDRMATLFGEEGKEIARQRFSTALGGLHEGNTLELRSFELEVSGTVAKDEWRSGRVFLPAGSAAAAGAGRADRDASSEKENRDPAGSSTLSASKRFRPVTSSGGGDGREGAGACHKRRDPASSGAVTAAGDATSAAAAPSMPPQRYDPSHPCAHELVPARPPRHPAVVTDPFLGHVMRPHQVEGVRFLYRRIADEDGLRRTLGGNGAILADEMGLGKTLQAIALVWTALKQGPYGRPLIQRAVVVCPASLVENWAREFKKWLGAERLQPLVLMTGDKRLSAKLTEFRRAALKPVAIVSYEMVRKVHRELSASDVGLVICDEGHRLKSAQGNKTIHALASIRCARRVLLTGTPLQNDLEEMWAMVNFANPGAVGDLPVFRAVFAEPIMRAQDSRATREECELGDTRAAELHRLTQQFILRRTTEMLAQFLPPRVDVTLFVPLSDVQREWYRAFLGSSSVKHLFGQRAFAQTEALSAIMHLRKLCNHPALLRRRDEPADDGDGDDGGIAAAGNADIADGGRVRDDDDSVSAKMLLVRDMLRAFRAVGDRVVLISNFTSTLDLFGRLCRDERWAFLRLDGSTPAKERDSLVSRFNDTLHGDTFCFLLSNKAGGVGLNLIGGNRLILYDSDWNPANDKQAMARVWRDGQRKAVYVYRLVTSGTIEEKIYQRQVFKSDLAIAMDSNGNGNGGGGGGGGGRRGGGAGQFSKEDLRELFSYEPEAHRPCETLELLRRRNADGYAPRQPTSHAPGEQSRRQRASTRVTADDDEDEDEDDHDHTDNEAEDEDSSPPAFGLLREMEPYASGERTVAEADSALLDVLARHQPDFAFAKRRNVRACHGDDKREGRRERAAS